MQEPFTTGEALASGISAGRLRGPRYQTVFRGVHVNAPTTVDLAIRCRAALLVSPPGACISGRSAAALFGWWLPPWQPSPDRVVEVTVPTSARLRRPGIASHRATVAPDELVIARGIPVTSPLRTLRDLAASCSLIDLVVLVDSACRRHGLRPADIANGLQPGRRGVRVLSHAVTLADPRSESPPETLLRLVPTLSGLPPPLVQVEIRDPRGGWLARVDLKVPGAPAVLEYDGADHWAADRHATDVARWRLLRAHDYEVYPYTKRELFFTPDQIVADYQGALGLPSEPGAVDGWLDHWAASAFGRRYGRSRYGRVQKR